MKSEWEIVSLEKFQDEVWETNTEIMKITFSKWKFPTRRWGNVYKKESTTDKELISKMIEYYKQQGFKIKKRIVEKTNYSTYYSIWIKK